MNTFIQKPFIVTPGTPQGIGPEVVEKGLRLLKNSSHSREFPFLIIGHKLLSSDFITKEISLSQLQKTQGFTPLKDGIIYWLKPNSQGNGRFKKWAIGKSVIQAAHLCLMGRAHGLITGPIDKRDLARENLPFKGHTDLLEWICHQSGFPHTKATMCLAHSKLRVTLVTHHIPIRKVPTQLRTKDIKRTIVNTSAGIKTLLGTKKPRLAVLALNPHGGEDGLIGHEESTIISPAIDEARKEGHLVYGPFSPDGFFSSWSNNKLSYDAVIGMYHDQVLIPLKLFGARRSINVTFGLPFIRTSVDHGTAMDIAGENIADATSFISATKAAISMSKRWPKP